MCSGMKKFPSPEGIAGMMKRKIIIDPWRVKKTLYAWLLKYLVCGESSSSRSSMANRPPIRKKAIVVQRYIAPIRLWSRVKAQERQPRSARYPLSFRSVPVCPKLSISLSASLPCLQVLHHRLDLLRRQGGLERRHHVGGPLHHLR